MTLEELLAFCKHRACSDPQTCCLHGDTEDETGKRAAEVFDLAEVMLILEEFPRWFDFPRVSYANSADGWECQWTGSRAAYGPTPAAAIRAAHEEWKK